MSVTTSSDTIIEELREAVVKQYSNTETRNETFEVANAIFQMNNWIHHSMNTHKDSKEDALTCVQNSLSCATALITSLALKMSNPDCEEMIKDIDVEYKKRFEQKEN